MSQLRAAPNLLSAPMPGNGCLSISQWSYGNSTAPHSPGHEPYLHNNSQPRITLSIRQGAHETRAAVSDNGMGFDEAVKARLFTYGFSTHPRGHGFGLHSARVSAQFLGGRVEAHSDGPGKGARLELILPRRRQAAAEESQGAG